MNTVGPRVATNNSLLNRFVHGSGARTPAFDSEHGGNGDLGPFGLVSPGS
jgi:hypothetical protein